MASLTHDLRRRALPIPFIDQGNNKGLVQHHHVEKMGFLQQLSHRPLSSRTSVLLLLLALGLMAAIQLRQASGVGTTGIPDDTLYGYRSMSEMLARTSRFPSVEGRVKNYMTNWYLPPCEDDEDAHVWFEFRSNSSTPEKLPSLYIREISVTGVKRAKVVQLEGNARMGTTLFYMDRHDIEILCPQRSPWPYCIDVVTYILPAWDQVSKNQTVTVNVPLILQFGDAESTRVIVPAEGTYQKYPHIPQIRKYRHVLKEKDGGPMNADACISGPRDIPENRKSVQRLQPIVWLITQDRHFGMLKEIQSLDIPWSDKKNVAVFRGALNGKNSDMGVGQRKKLAEKDDKEHCLVIPRCRLVFNTDASPLIDAKLTGAYRSERRVQRLYSELSGNDRNNLLPLSVGGVSLFDNGLNYEAMLKYKAIIMLEGNDLSSGFKWALLSNSVVMTYAPFYTSWAMEELLEPWVHYIPLNRELSDVQEKMQWVLDNDEEAQNIARRGTLWLLDLVFHPLAVRDDALVYEEMVRRYRAHFVDRTNF